MVESGQTEVRSVGFTSSDHPGAVVEVVPRADLPRRLGSTFFDRPDRPSFDIMMLVHRGTGMHTIDFQRIALVPSRLVRTLPGQVQTWDFSSDVDATLVFSRAVHPRSGRAPDQKAGCDLGIDSLATALALIDSLRREQDRFEGDDSSVRLMTSIFQALDALFDRAQPEGSTGRPPDAYTDFRQAIEAELGSSHTVRHYARSLGYSERTISRACQRVTGLSAKGFLDQRLVLEAKRLLAHTDRTAAGIATQLGFSEPTNFAKFFARHSGQRPADFRAANRHPIRADPRHG